jgi:hemolysin activation/secretion protein
LRLEGVTVFTAEELLEPYRRLNGQNISLAALDGIANELTAKYREAGYLLSRVVVPPQELEAAGAIVLLRAVEGFISSVEYVGEEALVRKFETYFRAVEAKLLAERPLRHADFERELLLLQDLPGVEVSSTFNAAEVVGGSVLILEVERDLVDGSISWGNTGTVSAGPGMSSYSLGINSLPVIGARTSLAVSRTDDWREYHSFQLGQSYRLANGLELSFTFSRSASPEPDTEFARTFDYETSSRSFSVGLSYPLIRTRSLNLRLGAYFDHRDSDSMVLDELYTRDKLRWMTVRADFDFSDELGGLTQISPTFIKGLRAFRATDLDDFASNPLARADYWIAELFVSRTQQLPGSFSAVASAQLRLADSSLPSFHKFSLGGSQFGRGYDSGVVEGDNGLGLSLETRWTLYLLDRIAMAPYAFIDWGMVWDKARHGYSYDEDGSSLGGGVRFWGQAGPESWPSFNVNFYMGKPLKRAGNADADPRYIINLALMF